MNAHFPNVRCQDNSRCVGRGLREQAQHTAPRDTGRGSDRTPPPVMANFKTVIRAHCVLYCAEVCSPAQFCFCLLVAVVFVHPPLDVSPIVSLQQWLIERDANERNEHRGLFFFLCHIQRASRPISADMIIVLFTPSLCLCRRISCVSNMLLSAHALSAVQRLCLNPPLPEAFLSPCYILV